MRVIEESRRRRPHWQRAVFLCLVLFSFIFSGTGAVPGHFSHVAAFPENRCIQHHGSINPDSVDGCPCSACHHDAVTCSCPAFEINLAAIVLEPVLRPLNQRVIVIPRLPLPTIRSAPSPLFRPPKFIAQG